MRKGEVLNLEGILALPEVKPVRGEVEDGIKLLYEQVDFWIKNSWIHTKEHCTRVLIFVLVIADKMDLSQEDREILTHAAAFHDARRVADGRDTGHGARAAEYYREFTQSSDLPYHPLTYMIMKYHDLHDEEGLKAMEGTEDPEKGKLLYKIFKDGDALDRFRLGPYGLDPSYLRTEAARELYDFAKGIWENYCS